MLPNWLCRPNRLSIWDRLSVVEQLLVINGRKLDALTEQGNKIMTTLADIVAADAQVKAELDTIAADVTALVASNQKLATDLAAAIAANDPAALQAALDQANANVTEAQAIASSFPTPAP